MAGLTRFALTSIGPAIRDAIARDGIRFLEEGLPGIALLSVLAARFAWLASLRTQCHIGAIYATNSIRSATVPKMLYAS